MGLLTQPANTGRILVVTIIVNAAISRIADIAVLMCFTGLLQS